MKDPSFWQVSDNESLIRVPSGARLLARCLKSSKTSQRCPMEQGSSLSVTLISIYFLSSPVSNQEHPLLLSYNYEALHLVSHAS